MSGHPTARDPEGAPPEPREFVLDSSVAVKVHVPEAHQEQAQALVAAVEAGDVVLSAPGTIYPESFNALWQLRRRGELEEDDVRAGWRTIRAIPLEFYAPEDLMDRASEITFETGVIVYDALFLALAEDAGTVMVTADDRLLRTIRGTAYESLAVHVSAVERLLRPAD